MNMTAPEVGAIVFGAIGMWVGIDLKDKSELYRFFNGVTSAFVFGLVGALIGWLPSFLAGWV